ncbi:MAG: FAD-binding oxidoreductase [Phycisphaerales bacterium]|nr:FAD-binding oxidoreductase [Phycisphaerales bacterium]
MSLSLSLPQVQDRDGLDSERLRIRALVLSVARGDALFGRHERMLYATDASLYQVEPIGVFVPSSVEDGANAARALVAAGVPILARGGGTALAGQTVNRAVVIDFSKHCRAIGDFDAVARTIEVEPGVVLDQLNAFLAPSGLMFGADVATSSHATLGGMIGNNSAGANSILYGRTVENLEALEVLLPTGERLWLTEGGAEHDPIQRRIVEQVARIVRSVEREIHERVPKILRHVDGYNLDLVLQQLDASTAGTFDRVNLAHLVCGSEGTLATILRARLRLVDRPNERSLAVFGFPSVTAALAPLQVILATFPAAVELVDDVILGVARANAEYRKYVDLMPTPTDGALGAVLYVEYFGATVAEVEAKTQALRALLPHAAFRKASNATERLELWKLRKAGEPLLHAMPGQRKPVTFVEDTAVDPARLPAFVERFRAIVSAHGTTAAYYAHASVGCLHIRPLIAILEPVERATMLKIAEAVADLVAEFHGALSGEHGDGRVRSPLLERVLGRALCDALRAVKGVFDPRGLLNPGNLVVTAPSALILEHLRIMPHGEPLPHAPVETYFDFSAQDGLLHAAAQCNGAGLCRRLEGGASMCPSYRALKDERHATRGRANALRLALTAQSGDAANVDFNDAETLATLDLCLSCKACKTECPSGVDLAKLKAEFLAQRFRALGGVPAQTRAFGRVRETLAFASKWWRVFAPFAKTSMARQLAASRMGVDPRRSLPPIGPSLFRWFSQRRAHESTRTVILFGDCFAGYSEPEIGRKAIALLEAFGYRVVLADVGCCGRSLISTGMLAEATQVVARASSALLELIDATAAEAVLVLEPSCASAIRDDWIELGVEGNLHERARRVKLASQTCLVEEFLDEHWDTHPCRPPLPEVHDDILLHAHCHQKALWGAASSARFLRRIFGARLTVLDTGCCGMAGSFGMTKEHYDLSLAIGEDRLFPALRADPSASVCASGASCRHQIHDGVGRTALHPVDLAYRALRLESLLDCQP